LPNQHQDTSISLHTKRPFHLSGVVHLHTAITSIIKITIAEAMIRRNFIVKHTDFFNTVQKYSLEINPNREIIKSQKHFTQLWRQWPCSLKVEIHHTSYRFNHYQSYTVFDM